MQCRQCLLNFGNFLGLLLGVALLVLGVRTGLGGLTGLGVVVLVVAFVGYCGTCTHSGCLLIAYSISMVLLAMMCVLYLVNPASVKPLVAEQLEEFILAAYLNSEARSLDELPCCPKLPLERPKNLETWATNKFVSIGNKIACVSAGVLGTPSCEAVIDKYLDVYGKNIAITVMVLAILAAAVAADGAVRNIRRK